LTIGLNFWFAVDFKILMQVWIFISIPISFINV
jgi:hypothetical protein